MYIGSFKQLKFYGRKYFFEVRKQLEQFALNRGDYLKTFSLFANRDLPMNIRVINISIKVVN